MDFKELEAYVRVVELNSFSKAAESIFISQPSVSAYVNSLEKDLGSQLLFRSTKEVLPTKSGTKFYEYAKNMLALRDKSMLALSKMNELTSGHIDILASSVPSTFILPGLIAKFQKNYPDCSFSVQQTDSVDVAKNVASRKYDFGFVGAKSDFPNCVFEYFAKDELILIAPNNGKYQERITDFPKWLAGERFVLRQKGSGTRHNYDEFLRIYGLPIEKLNVVAEFSNTHSIINAVAQEMGVSIVSSIAAQYFIEKGFVIPVSFDKRAGVEFPARNFYLTYKKDSIISAISECFIDFAKAESSGVKLV